MIMKKNIKRILFLSIILVSLSLQGFGQEKGKRFSPEEFRARTEAFIGQRAGFTSEESQKFFPLYHEMKGKQWKLMMEMGKLKQQKPTSSSTDKEYATIVNKIKDLGEEIAQLEATYYKRMCKVVSAKKVFEAMQAEDEFHRKTLSRFNHNRKRDGKHGPEKRD